ncbi:MAG: MBL fold metallo-hydrolase [Elusimicrobiota bacterium]
MKTVILYDNKRYLKGWESGWGFSALIINDSNQRLLFDTGDNSKKLLKNIAKAGIEPQSIDVLTFSHKDWDHKDGAEGFLKINKKAHVYIPRGFDEEFKKMVKKSGHPYTLSGYSKMELIQNVYTTPLYSMPGGPEEQALVIYKKEALILITGCAHPGILNMVRKVKAIFNMDVDTIAGGFHLKDFSEYKVRNLIEDLKKEGVKKFAPCHCTGDRQIAVFEKKGEENFIQVGSGREIIF